MLKITIWVARSSSDHKNDDIIKMSTTDEYPDMIRIVYRTPEIKKKEHLFYLNRRDTIEYVKELFSSLSLDTEPFESIQLSTDIHPSVMFSIADLEQPPVSTVLISMITKSLYTNSENITYRW